MLTRQTAPSVTLNTIKTDKFKNAFVTVSFLSPLEPVRNTENALIPRVLMGSSEKYGDLRRLNVELDRLYGAQLLPMCRKKGETQLVGFAMSFICDEYALGGEKVFDGAVSLLGEVLLHPKTEKGGFDPAVAELEKRQLREKLQSRINDKMRYGVERCHEIMCEGEPFALSASGAEEDIDGVTPEGLYKRYRDLLRTAPVEIFYIGPADEGEVEAAFSRMFRGIEREPKDCPATTVGRAGEIRVVEEKMDVTQCKLTIGCRTGVRACDDDYCALALANAVFGGGPTSKLFMNVREKLSLCYYASSAVDKLKGIITVYSGVDQKNIDRAREEIEAQLNDLKAGRVTDDEIEAARLVIINALRAAADSPASMEDFALGGTLCGKKVTFEEQIEGIKAVTREQMLAAARKIVPDTVFVIKGEK